MYEQLGTVLYMITNISFEDQFIVYLIINSSFHIIFNYSNGTKTYKNVLSCRKLIIFLLKCDFVKIFIFGIINLFCPDLPPEPHDYKLGHT